MPLKISLKERNVESPAAGLAVWDHVGDLLLEAGAKPQISFI